MDQDLEHLKLLSIFHYVVGGMMALFACFPLLHLFFGIALDHQPPVALNHLTHKF